jgi:hypothetical protein
LNLLSDNKHVFSPAITHLVWIYAIENKALFKEVKQYIPKSRFMKGFASIQSQVEEGTLFPKRKDNDHFLLVIDDRMFA